MADGTCSVEGCAAPLRSPGARWCSKHYHRWYRHGDPLKTARSVPSVSPPRRYQRTTAKGHPLANKHGGIWVHRRVLFDLIGWGPHPCHWCQRPVEWKAEGEGELQVDHLDNDSGNNDPTNLVASCRCCNGGRGMQRRSDILRSEGWWSNHDTIATTASQTRRTAIEADRR